MFDLSNLFDVKMSVESYKKKQDPCSALAAKDSIMAPKTAVTLRGVANARETTLP